MEGWKLTAHTAGWSSQKTSLHSIAVRASNLMGLWPDKKTVAAKRLYEICPESLLSQFQTEFTCLTKRHCARLLKWQKDLLKHSQFSVFSSRPFTKEGVSHLGIFSTPNCGLLIKPGALLITQTKANKISINLVQWRKKFANFMKLKLTVTDFIQNCTYHERVVQHQTLPTYKFIVKICNICFKPSRCRTVIR